ncbi:GDP/GTP exchange factor Sec2p-domain-containing protein [Mortierella sp. GBAus27b]|nr:Guanine nucleotide exchange factor (GEF) which may activate RAB8A and RAB8B [Mortierella sp. GBA43]KAI8355975.1 GDP/GTP exchange factor Sec2p-domain-containing protein [Mortierella sp. GBAus27b]
MQSESDTPAVTAISVAMETATTTSTVSDSHDNANGGDHVQEDECPCHRVNTTYSGHTCGICQRVIPSLAELTRLTAELEQTKSQFEEEHRKALAGSEEATTLRDKIQQLDKELGTKADELSNVQRDLAILNDKYIDEIEKVAEMQHAKEAVENELEELSRRLFEEANGMVATEARARHELEIARKHLELELKDAQDRLAAETLQLKELKSMMENMMDSQPQSKRSSTVHSDRGSVDLAQLFGLSKISETEPVVKEPETAIAIDGQLVQEFREFVAQSASVRLAKLHSISFMRHCQDEDVEPCLRFGNNPRISARKLAEGICSNTCYIEGATAEQVAEYERAVLAAQQPPSPARHSMSSTNMLWERLQTQYAIYQAPKGGCQTCGRPGPLTHRYRIATTDEWSFIDRFCRDRLVAACEFYIFIRNIRAGLYASRSIEDLYSECLRLRLQMFYARSGVLPIMLAELGVTSQSIGNMGPSGEWPEGIHPRVSDVGSVASATPSRSSMSEKSEPPTSRPQTMSAGGNASRKESEEKARTSFTGSVAPSEPSEDVTAEVTVQVTAAEEAATTTAEAATVANLSDSSLAGPESTPPSTLEEREVAV